MSYDVNVFVRASSREAILEMLRNRFDTRIDVAETAGGPATAMVFGISIAVIGQHEIEDDCGIPFSKYPQQVSFTLYAGRMDPDVGHELCRSMAFAFAKAIHDEGGADYLLVEGVQRVIAGSG